MRQQCSFFKSSIAFAAAVLLFQIQRCICGDSVPFSNPTLFSPQQCCSNPAVQTRQEH